MYLLYVRGNSVKMSNNANGWMENIMSVVSVTYLYFSVYSVTTKHIRTWSKPVFKCPLSSLCFFLANSVCKQRWQPWPLICWNISNFSATIKQFWWNLTRSKYSTILPKLCFFFLWSIVILSTKMAARTSGWLTYVQQWKEFWQILTGRRYSTQSPRARLLVFVFFFQANLLTKMATLVD